MRTGVAYLGHHNPQHLKTDLSDLARLGCDDVLVAAQENDFAYMKGKLEFLPPIAKDKGLSPIAIFWGALNLFGGGRSSQFLLEHPEAHQVNQDGSWNPAGCYNNPICVNRIKEMIDHVAERGFEGYFIDEPTPLNCYCDSCRRRFQEWCGADLLSADDQTVSDFRRRCVTHYIGAIAKYVKNTHPGLETLCCLTPDDRALWPEAAAIEELDHLGTDFYWANDDLDLEQTRPVIREMAALCHDRGKRHHQWLQCWGVRKGREPRIAELGQILISEQPDALYAWAYEGQVGTTESCDDPELAWSYACQVLKLARAG